MSFEDDLVAAMPELRRYAKRLVGVDDACDLENSTVLRAIASRETYHDEMKMVPWLVAIMRNIHRDELRILRRRNRALSKMEAVTKVDVYGGNEAALKVERIANLLPTKLRTVFTKVAEGKTHRTIAKELGVPIGTIHGRMERALAIIKKGVQEGWLSGDF